MKRSALFWMLAVVVMVVSAVYQRVTGPSYPVSGSAEISGRMIPYKFDRSHAGPTDAPVEVKTGDPSVTGVLFWKRYKSDDSWTQVPMSFVDGTLKAGLPHQPVAGKLLYRVELRQGDQQVTLPGLDPIVIRFRGGVPIFVLIPHLFAMFGALLFSARAGLEYFSTAPKPKKLTYWTLGFLFAGGFILGPLMQHYSFDVWWTGWPVGTDLTDNKTAIAFVAWVVAALALSREKHPGRWALGASIIMLLVYLIPHSILGSELDYREIDKQSNKVRTVQ